MAKDKPYDHKRCGGCQTQREGVGREGMQMHWDPGIYVDPFVDEADKGPIFLPDKEKMRRKFGLSGVGDIDLFLPLVHFYGTALEKLEDLPESRISSLTLDSLAQRLAFLGEVERRLREVVDAYHRAVEESYGEEILFINSINQGEYKLRKEINNDKFYQIVDSEAMRTLRIKEPIFPEETSLPMLDPCYGDSGGPTNVPEESPLDHEVGHIPLHRYLPKDEYIPKKNPLNNFKEIENRVRFDEKWIIPQRVPLTEKGMLRYEPPTDHPGSAIIDEALLRASFGPIVTVSHEEWIKEARRRLNEEACRRLKERPEEGVKIPEERPQLAPKPAEKSPELVWAEMMLAGETDGVTVMKDFLKKEDK